MTPNKLPLVMFAALAGLVIVVVIGMLTASWLWFAVALAVQLVASYFVLSGSFKAAQSGSRADANSEALERKASDAVADDEPRNVETELEALKRE
jgi:hypothetical protein